SATPSTPASSPASANAPSPTPARTSSAPNASNASEDAPAVAREPPSDTSVTPAVLGAHSSSLAPSNPSPSLPVPPIAASLPMLYASSSAAGPNCSSMRASRSEQCSHMAQE